MVDVAARVTGQRRNTPDRCFPFYMRQPALGAKEKNPRLNRQRPVRSDRSHAVVPRRLADRSDRIDAAVPCKTR